mmetsp:Transcript_73553/g.209438  ORF Transcript_73553/g.209438 Transcript_73553/m.209438 type:complete len:376 (+) Transcript_73553:296-1423(+)
MAKGKKGQAAEPAASRNSSMDVYRPTIQHIISDHAGTVLDENKPEPEPDLTPQEEHAATVAYNAVDKGDGVDAPMVRKLLVDLGLTLSPEQQALYIDKFWADKGLDLETGKLGFHHFIECYAVAYAPGRLYGNRLRKAAGREFNEMVTDLVNRGCDPFGFDGGGFNSLHHAAQYGKLSTMQLLIEVTRNRPPPRLGPRPTTSSLTSTPALALAQLAKSRSAELIGATGDPNNADRCGSWSPLMVASANGQEEATKLLLDAGASHEAVTNEGRTALHWACAKGFGGVVQILCKAGASVDAEDTSGWRPLHCALFHNHTGVAAQLVTSFKADMEAQDHNGGSLGHSNLIALCAPPRNTPPRAHTQFMPSPPAPPRPP